MTEKTDVVVIGGGPGGYVCAIRLAQLGKKVVLAEKHKIGGVCLNYGCIPSKALIAAAKAYSQAHHAQEFGIECNNINVNWERVIGYKDEVVVELTSGIKELCEKNGVQIVWGEAKLPEPHTVEITTDEGVKSFNAENIVIATGSTPIQLPGMEFDGKTILDSTDALSLPTIPKKLLIVGGGVIGLEIGIFLAKFGTKVTIVELLDQILPGTDKPLVVLLNRNLREFGIEVYTKSKVLSLEKNEEGVLANIETPGETFQLQFDKALVTVGRKPVSRGFGFRDSGIKMDNRGFILVNERMQTTVPHIFAIGDVTGQPFLAHRASKQGVIVAEVIAGHDVKADYNVIPGVVYSDPEIATAGMTASEAKERGINVSTGKMMYLPSSKAILVRKPKIPGFVNFVVEEPSKKVLGVQIIGSHASDLLMEAVVAIENGLTIEAITKCIHPHPTLGEVVLEAAEDTMLKAIHKYRRRKPSDTLI